MIDYDIRKRNPQKNELVRISEAGTSGKRAMPGNGLFKPVK